MENHRNTGPRIPLISPYRIVASHVWNEFAWYRIGGVVRFKLSSFFIVWWYHLWLKTNMWIVTCCLVPVESPKPVLTWRTPSHRGMRRMEGEYLSPKWVAICKEYGTAKICVPIRYVYNQRNFVVKLMLGYCTQLRIQMLGIMGSKLEWSVVYGQEALDKNCTVGDCEAWLQKCIHCAVCIAGSVMAWDMPCSYFY